jgi:DNA-binding NarL/FixJ family response regulator
MSVRILLADDHGIVRDGIRISLENHSDLEVVAEVDDGFKAVEAVRRIKPDLVVMDVSMPGMNGIEATRQITAEDPAAKVLCLSMHMNRRFMTAALEAGAAGYLLKDRALEELVEAIRTVMAGRVYLCQMVASTVAEARVAGVFEPRPLNSPTLTAREREVLQLVAEGLSGRQIASKLHVSLKTVSTHRQHIMDKLEIHNAAGLTKYAIEHGLTSVDTDELT